MKKWIFILLTLLQLGRSQPVEHSQHDSLFLGIERKTLLNYSLVAYSLSSFYVEYQWWWKGNYRKFQYGNDGFANNYSLGVDKAGHFYTSYFYFNALYECMEWGGFDEQTKLLTSIAIPAFYALSIEINDGFTMFSFSGYDLTANMAGIGYGVLQRQFPILQNFKFKWSYYPSGTVTVTAKGKFPIASDYDGHIYWLSVDVHGLLPSHLKNYWPKFLNLAVGYGAKNVSHQNTWLGEINSSGPPARKFAVSLDYNLVSFNIEDDLLYTVRNIVDYFRFPAPGVRLIGDQKADFRPLLVN
jgi:hypothetical protein